MFGWFIYCGIYAETGYSETDCLYVYKFLSDANFDRSTLVHLKKEAVGVMNMLPDLKLAHNIAKFCYSCKTYSLLVGGVPSCVMVV